MSVENSRELLRRYAREGDENAFRLLVERHAGLVYSAAQRKLGPLAAHAADVAQAVFIRLAQRAKVLPEEIVLAAWLHSMAVRYALNHLRTERRRSVREQTAFTMNADDGTTVGWPQIASEIDDALAALSARDREAILLRYVEDHDLADTGQSLGISADAAQKRIARALERLRVQLLKRGVVAGVATVTACLAAPVIRAAPCGFAAAAAGPALEAGRKATANWLTMIAESWKAFPGPALAGTTIAALASCAAIWIPARNSPQRTESNAPPAAVVESSVAVESLAPAAAEVMQLLHEQLSPAEIVAELGRTCMAPRTGINRARMAALLELIHAGNAATVTDLAERNLSLTAAYRIMRTILERWCRFDAAAALDFVLRRNLDGKLLDQRFGIAWYLFKEWRIRDRSGAAAWLVKNVNDPNLRNPAELAGPLMEDLAARSPREAIAFVKNLPSGDLKSQLMTGLCGKHGPGEFRHSWTAVQWNALASAVVSENDGLPSGVLPAIIREWAQRDDAAVRQWLENLPAGARKLAAATGLVAVGNMWRDTPLETGGFSRASVPVTDRPNRASAALAAAGSLPRGPVLAQIAVAWPEPDDSDVEWFRDHAQGPDGDAALQVLAGKMAADSHAASVQARAIRAAAQITDPALRADVMAGVFLRWHMADADAAEAWLPASGLPVDSMAILTDAVAP